MFGALGFYKVWQEQIMFEMDMVKGHPIKTEIVRRGRIEIRCWLWNVSLHVACFDLPE